MAVVTRKITKTAVDSLTTARGTEFLWDTELKGFGVKIISHISPQLCVFQDQVGGLFCDHHRGCACVG